MLDTQGKLQMLDFLNIIEGVINGVKIIVLLC